MKRLISTVLVACSLTNVAEASDDCAHDAEALKCVTWA